MNTPIRLKVDLAADKMSEALAFYQQCQRPTQLHDSDTLVTAYIDEVMVGVVRLCAEENFYTLRTMQVAQDRQGQGVGRLLLNRFKKVLLEQGITTVFCLSYAHLEKFYGGIGFQKIAADEAPVLLQNRLQTFHKKHPDKSAVLMKLLT
jgi:N-acetylglutamate synthase-like GNAT family acetyltransferase